MLAHLMGLAAAYRANIDRNYMGGEYGIFMAGQPLLSTGEKAIEKVRFQAPSNSPCKANMTALALELGSGVALG